MIDLQKFFKAINVIGVTQTDMAEHFNVSSPGSINNWANGKKTSRCTEEEIFVGTNKCLTKPINKPIDDKGRKREPILFTPDQFIKELIQKLAISERERAWLFEIYANNGYEQTLRQIIHLAKTEQVFVPDVYSYEINNPVRPIVAAGQDHVLAVFSNGHVRSTGNTDDLRCNTLSWRDIVSVVACRRGSVGLRADGRCEATGAIVTGNRSLFDWTDITALAAGPNHVLGLRLDGTVVSFGRNPFGQCGTDNWKNIIAIAAGNNHSVGLLNDGTVIAAGENKYGQCDVNSWKDVRQIAAAGDHTLALLSDGTVVGCGNLGTINLEELKGTKMIATGDSHAVGLKEDGCVINSGADIGGLSDVERWHHMIAIAAGFSTTIGVRADGRVFVTRDKHKAYYLSTENWKLFENEKADEMISQFDRMLTDFREKLAAFRCQLLKVSPYISEYHDNIKILDFSLFPEEYGKLRAAVAPIFPMYEASKTMPTIHAVVEMFLSAFLEMAETIREEDGTYAITDATYDPFMDLLFTINQLEPEIRQIEEGLSFPDLIEKQMTDFEPLIKKIPRWT